jgi:succinate dehydrogenase/fumarate reductase iron-sulfur protein
MNISNWQITLRIFRKRHEEAAYYQKFSIEADPDENILDLIERVWAYQDRTLTYRHACHHSTCGACGVRVNGKEKLACITKVRSMTRDGGEVTIEPLRNFPIISDLVVDMGPFFLRMGQSGLEQVAPLREACLPFERKTLPDGNYERLVDCIECGLCISVCPAAATNRDYVGPAVLAAVQHRSSQGIDKMMNALSDSSSGLWRCHSAFECTEVCPSNVDPGWRIMDLRRKTFAHKIKHLFSASPKD